MPHCLLCESENYSLWAEENGHALLKCGNCGLLYLQHIPAAEEREEALRTGLHRGESTLSTNTRPDPERIDKYLETLKNFYPDANSMQGRKWLDIGAGNGEWTAALRRYFHNIECTAVEPNQQKRQSPYFADSMVLSSIEELDHDLKFDVISMLNVWSHLTDPKDFLNQIARRLNRHGELLIQTGNAAEIKRYEYPGKLLLPDHVSFASPALIENLLQNQGSVLVKLIKYRLPAKLTPLFLIKLLAKFLLGLQPHPYGFVSGRFRDCWMRFRKNQDTFIA